MKKYSAEGKLIEENCFNSDGIVSSSSKYNNQGYIIEIKKYNNDGILSLAINYNDFGKIKEKKSYCNGYLSLTINYNNSEKKIKDIIYDSCGSLLFKNIYKYDAEGNLFSITTYNSALLKISYERYNDDEKQGEIKYEYDDYGKLWFIRTYNSLGWLKEEKDYFNDDITYYNYYENGKLEEKSVYTVYEIEGRILSTIYEFNSLGLLIKEKNYDHNGEDLHHYCVYKYDDNGKLEEKIIYDCEKMSKTPFGADGNIYIIEKYNNNGKLTEEKYYNLDGTLSSSSKYSEEGKKLEANYFSKGILYMKIKYNDDGTSKMYTYNSDGSISIIE